MVTLLGSGLEELHALEDRLAAAKMTALALPTPILSASAANDMTAGVLRTVLRAAEEGRVAGAVHADLAAPLLVEGLDFVAQVRHFAFLGLEVATEPESVITVCVSGL